VLLLGFVAGAAADRLSRSQVMVTADLSRAGIAALLAVFHSQLWTVYAAAFRLSPFSVFSSPATASALPALAGEADVAGANSAAWSAAVISQIALAPAADALVAAARAGPAFALNAVSFLASAALLTPLPLPARPPAAQTRRLAEKTEGLRAVCGSRFLSALAGVQALAALSAGATSALLFALAGRHLHAGAGRFGLVLAAIGLAAGFGPLALQRLVHDVRHADWLFGPYQLRGLVDRTLAATTSFGVAVGALAVYGAGTSTSTITCNPVPQTGVPDQIRSRVFAFYDVVWQTARLASIELEGVLADAYGSRWCTSRAAPCSSPPAFSASAWPDRQPDQHPAGRTRHEPEPRSAPGSGRRRRRISLRTTGCPGL